MKEELKLLEWGVASMARFLSIIGLILGALLSFVYIVTHFDFPLPYPTGGSTLELALCSLGYAIIAYFILLGSAKSIVLACKWIERKIH